MTETWRVLTATSAVVLASVVWAAPASADSGPAVAAGNPHVCGNTCDGKNPATYRRYDYRGWWYTCSADAVTVKTHKPTAAPRINLRYSPKCETAWAQLEGPTDYAFKVESFHLSGSKRLTYRGDLGTNYTRMVNDHRLLARACVYVPYGDWSCTGKY